MKQHLLVEVVSTEWSFYLNVNSYSIMFTPCEETLGGALSCLNAHRAAVNVLPSSLINHSGTLFPSCMKKMSFSAKTNPVKAQNSLRKLYMEVWPSSASSHPFRMSVSRTANTKRTVFLKYSRREGPVTEETKRIELQYRETRETELKEKEKQLGETGARRRGNGSACLHNRHVTGSHFLFG